MDGGAGVNVVVAVDAEDVLHYVAGTLHVDAVGGYAELGFATVGLYYLYFEGAEDALDGIGGDILAYEATGVVV